MKHVVLLGSSGSIGENTLRVVASLPSRLRLTGLAVHSDYRRVLEQAAQCGARYVAVADPTAAEQCAAAAPAGITVCRGPAGVRALASCACADTVLCAIVGLAGLDPVLAALEQGIDVALATKEVLVAAGRIALDACARGGARLLPVDSEHSAIHQCLGGAPATGGVRRLVLTASGGPFAGRPELDLDSVSVSDALAHPRWDMGRKVTVDSATLMNKGLEIMEAQWLFGVGVDKIDVVIHPESIVHSLVEFVDGNVIAQLSLPDMRHAIQYALTFPERVAGELPRLDLVDAGPLTFAEPDGNRFPCLRLAREAALAGGTMPAVLNGANEAAVNAFLAEKLPFSGIWDRVERAMSQHRLVAEPDLDEILEADDWARRKVGELVC